MNVAWPDSELSRVLGITRPIVQAPIGSATTVELAAAVSRAGALGSLALSWRPVDRLVSLFWGDPRPYVDEVHAAGGRVLHTVGSVDEARRAVDAGVDVIVAQGWEAGGHVRGQVATMALVPAVVDAVGNTPVIAAGGIADRRGIAAALALGASGAMLGTRFLLAEEADTHPVYRQAIRAAGADEAIHMQLFEGGWPNAPHRALPNSTYREWRRAGSPPRGRRPGEDDVVATRDGRPVLRYCDGIPTADARGAVEPLAMYAGQGVGLVRDVEPARQIVEDLDRDARRVFAGRPG